MLVLVCSFHPLRVCILDVSVTCVCQTYQMLIVPDFLQPQPPPSKKHVSMLTSFNMYTLGYNIRPPLPVSPDRTTASHRWTRVVATITATATVINITTTTTTTTTIATATTTPPAPPP